MALWTPSLLSGSKLHRWIKGESFSHSGSTITGGTTSDSSATTISSSSWPTYNTSALNGYPTITSGGSNLMSLPVDIDYDCSVFAVFKPNAIGGYHNVYEQSGDKSPMLWIDSSNRFSMNGAGAVIEPSTPTADGSTWRVVSTINRSSGTRSEERIDGTSRGTNVESVGSLNVGTGLTLKLLGRSSGNGLQGDLAEFVITYGALTSDDEARIEGYLAWKYGLQSQLASGHAYKAAAPTDGTIDPLIAEPGGFTLTGQAAGLRATRRLQAGAGAFAVTGQSATLRRALRLTAQAGGFALSGQDVAFSLAGGLMAQTGVFALTGQAAQLRASRRLAAAAGAFAVTGQAAGLRAQRRLAAGAGVFDLQGRPAGLLAARTLRADAGVFLLDGQPVEMERIRTLLAQAGPFELTGQDAAFGLTGGFRAAAGVFVLTGHEARLAAVLARFGGRVGGARRPVLGGDRPRQAGATRPPQRI